jgi:hypothetical protein
MDTFKNLKRNSSSQFEKLNKELQKLNSGGFNKDDDKYWSCQTDKAGNGHAIIRFLPAPPNEDMPFVRIWNHGFKGPTGNWYIENCLSTIGEYDDDPVNQLNSKLWNSGVEDDKAQVREQKRRLSYHSNIYVVKDPANPENEGKVFLFRYGKKIFDKLSDKMNPQFDDENPIDPFNLWEGANFRLRIRKVEGFSNYDKSDFEEAGPLLDDDEELEKIWKQEHSLSDLIAPNKFKSFDDLQKRLNKVLGINQESSVSSSSQPREQEIDTPAEKEISTRSEQQAKSTKQTVVDDDDDDDDSLAFLRKIAEED